MFSQLSVAFVNAAGKNYAVLVAGSNGYYNYRHQVCSTAATSANGCLFLCVCGCAQSDVCHAYHVLTEKGGIDPQNIIVFMFDDIGESAVATGLLHKLLWRLWHLGGRRS